MEADEDRFPFNISNTEYQYVMPRLPSSFLPQGNDTSWRSDSEPSSGISSSGSNESFSTDESEEFTYHVGPIVLRRPRNRLEQRRVVRGGVFGLYHEIYTTIGEIFSNPNRVIMCMVWLGYTISIMIIANSFFPYMLLYSLLFILILYAETMQDQGRQLRNA
ncbi:hypothetical protein FSP39_014108 [Pinctada imbricata]|uniref:Uncharacterized protein n=1 Tax=Pinctada imbricata TaxID=66713 RepID=A0AA88YCN4_PINIB|nr:hypothetical protein FSP39_014108 [Pinctada imbricata]